MKTAILLLVVRHVTAFISVEYNGFQNCGENGWMCDDSVNDSIYPWGKKWGSQFSNSDNAIIFDCSLTRSPNTRVWIWTARLPAPAVRFVVQNCDILELHVDCTSGHRNSRIQEFRAINISRLVILETTERYIYLHDNSPVPHLPPVFHLENVNTNFYPGLFYGRDDKNCEYNSEPMKKFVMKNVTVHSIPRDTFVNMSLDRLVWSNVRIRDIEANAVKFNGTAEISNCHFEKILPSAAIAIQGTNVSFVGNKFMEIYPNAISVYSFRFNFESNWIGHLISKGMAIRSSQISFRSNTITNIGKDALSGLSAALYPQEAVFKISYTFVGNEFINLSPFSLHCDWESYNNTCSTIVIEGNKFDCSCTNLIWMRELSEKNVSIDVENAGFYELLFQTTHHCSTSVNCTLSSILKYVCGNNATLESQCSGLKEQEIMEEKANISVFVDDTKDDSFDWSVKLKDNVEGVDGKSVALDNSYYEDRVSEGTDFEVVPAVVSLFVILFLSGILAAFLFWYCRRKQHRGTAEIYKYDKNYDADLLITNPISENHATECENPSFHDGILPDAESF
ncbi:UNVERIFIED_CONTAM: hypothetical protein PYX00_007053 [Menopon gallinae]|uniref:Uncharacterized protein n=1 Tax=Menopon gallinae TaxID=328185 RepID=A0AAW2HHL8_9NEOP